VCNEARVSRNNLKGSSILVLLKALAAIIVLKDYITTVYSIIDSFKKRVNIICII